MPSFNRSSVQPYVGTREYFTGDFVSFLTHIWQATVDIPIAPALFPYADFQLQFGRGSDAIRLVGGPLFRITEDDWFTVYSPFTPTATYQWHIHFLYDGGVQTVVHLSGSGQFNEGSLSILDAAGSTTVVDQFRLVRRDDGALHLEGHAAADRDIDAINGVVLGTEQGNNFGKFGLAIPTGIVLDTLATAILGKPEETSRVYEEVLQVAHGLATGDPVHYDPNLDIWVLSRSDDFATLKAGVVERINDDNINVVIYGSLSLPAHGLLTPNTYYLSPTDTGGIIPLLPRYANSFAQGVFETISDDIVKVVDQGVFFVEPGDGHVSLFSTPATSIANYLPDIGEQFVIRNGGAEVTGGEAVNNRNNVTLLCSTPVESSFYGRIAMLGTMGAGANRQIGTVFRYQDANNYWWFRQLATAMDITLWIGNAIAFQLTDATGGTVNDGAPIDLLVIDDGERIQCFDDGVLIFDVTDPRLSASTGIGLHSHNNALPGSRFDSITCSNI